MKIFLWVVLGLLVTGLAFWILTMPGVPHNPVLMFLIIVVFVVSPFGSFWMLYMSVRHERRPLPMVLWHLSPTHSCGTTSSAFGSEGAREMIERVSYGRKRFRLHFFSPIVPLT